MRPRPPGLGGGPRAREADTQASRSLARNRPFWALWTGQGISRLGSGVSAIAVVILVYDRTGSGLAIAGILLARNAPSLAAPLAGVISDRIDRRLAMVLSDLTSAGLVVTVAFTDALGVIYVLVALMGIASAVSWPAATASVPELVREEDLTRANSLSSLAMTASILGGSALGGALVASVGLRPAFFVDAASFAVSASLVATLLPPCAPFGESPGRPSRSGRSFAGGSASRCRSACPWR